MNLMGQQGQRVAGQCTAMKLVVPVDGFWGGGKKGVNGIITDLLLSGGEVAMNQQDGRSLLGGHIPRQPQPMAS